MHSSIVRSGGPVLPLLPLVLILFSAPLCGQVCHGADAVESFTLGTGYGTGYGTEYFPANVLGLPDTSARPTVPSIDPKQVLGLGLGGDIVLRFDAAPILDGPGADFVVYENAFRYTIGGKERVYAEPAEVAVSRDGVEWRTFLFDSLSLSGCAGVTPTDGRYSPSDSLSGGDRFDLALLGVDSVRYVRLHDITWMVRADATHPFYDYTLNGFDLDAVVNISRPSPPAGFLQHGDANLSLAPSISDGRTSLRLDLRQPGHVRCTLIDAAGDRAESLFDELLPSGKHLVPITARRSGAYLVRVECEGEPPVSLRWIVVR